jgi:hypothetical protein
MALMVSLKTLVVVPFFWQWHLANRSQYCHFFRFSELLEVGFEQNIKLMQVPRMENFRPEEKAHGVP